MPREGLEPFASIEDLAARWRLLSDDEAARAEVLLGDASAQLRAAMRGRVDPDDLVQARALEMTCCNMVRRAMSGGSDAAGISSASQGAGGFTASVTYANPNGDMFISASERRALGIGAARMGCASPFGEGRL